MISVVRSNIIENNLIVQGDNIVVGVSGGPDSMALLYALLEIKKEIGFNIIIAHVNHGVRGADALADQVFVEGIAKDLNLTYHFKNVDMVLYGKENKISAEEAGRELRYGFFREILKDVGGGKIAVAHNKNDQAETLLLRIMRGTGLDGLAGMEFIYEDIIRPLLNVSRDEIESYIEINNISTVLDKTNLMPIYARNKVRLELIPYIEENFNPNIINTLWRLSQTSSIDSSFLDEYCEERFNIVVKKVDKHSIILEGLLFNKEHISIRNRIIRKAILLLTGTLQGYSEQHISSLIHLFLDYKTGKSLNLPGGLIGKVSYDELILELKEETKVKDYNYELNMGENHFEDLGLNIVLSQTKNTNDFVLNGNEKHFDFDKISGKINIRNRKPGDKFVPLGMTGNKKVKDYFIDEKVDRNLRDTIPIIVDDNNILWIMGYVISDLYKVTKETKRILRIEFNYSSEGI